jgi:dihydroxyacetone kinase
VSDKDVISAVLTLAEQIEIDMDGESTSLALRASRAQLLIASTSWRSGTSGALYSIFFNGLASGLRSAAEKHSSKTATSAVWADALAAAKTTLFEYTRGALCPQNNHSASLGSDPRPFLPSTARSPSRTLVDPLEAFVNAFSSNSSDLAGAVQAAVDAAAHTAKIDAKAGRAAYVGREELAKANVPDPGAHGVAILLQGLLKSLQ